MPARGYHIYSCDDFNLPDGWESDSGDIRVGEPEEHVGVLTLSHPVSYFQTKEERIRVGSYSDWSYYNSFEREMNGTIWFSNGYALIEITDPPAHKIGRVLGAENGVDWTRLVVPALKQADEQLPSKTGRGLEDPANPNRRNVSHFGDDVARDSTNSAELAQSHLNFVQFGERGGSARAFDSGTLLLYGSFESAEEAAAEAAIAWDTYFARHAVSWSRGWRKWRKL